MLKYSYWRILFKLNAMRTETKIYLES